MLLLSLQEAVEKLANGVVVSEAELLALSTEVEGMKVEIQRL